MTDSQKRHPLKLRPKEENIAKLRAWREAVAVNTVGCRMPDGTVFAGVLADGRKVFAMPCDAGVALDFNAAAAYTERLNNNKTHGHDDWRMPDKEELDLLYKNRDKGALKNTFNGDWHEIEYEGDYWSSTRAPSMLPLYHVLVFDTGSWARNHINARAAVRCVR